MRNAVKVGLQLLIKADNRGFQVFTYVEAGNQQASAGHGGGVNILDPGQLVEQFFHGYGNPFFNLPGSSTRHGDHDIDHGHLDLRFLFARQQDDRQQAKQHGPNNDDQGKLGVNKGCRQLTGKTGMHLLFFHLPAVTG